MPTNPKIITTIKVPVLEEVNPIVNNQSHAYKDLEDFKEEDLDEIETRDEVPRITLASIQGEP